MTTVAEYLADRLWHIGARRVYGLPGGENVEMLDALRRRGIGFVLARNESSACFMAATEARLSGVPGVALTTLGPGRDQCLRPVSLMPISIARRSS